MKTVKCPVCDLVISRRIAASHLRHCARKTARLLPETDRWRERALCATRPDLPWVEAHKSTLPEMLCLCLRCPVRPECLSFASRFPLEETAGVWAGLLPEDREKLLLRLRRKARVAVCGTDSGYHAHLRRRETPCDDCRSAHAAAARRRAG